MRLPYEYDADRTVRHVEQAISSPEQSARRLLIEGADHAEGTRETKLRALVRMELHRFPGDLVMGRIHLHPGRLIEAVDRPDSQHLPPSGILIRRVEKQDGMAALAEARRQRERPETADELLIAREILRTVLGEPFIVQDTLTPTRAYAEALWVVLKRHVDSVQAHDCANNLANPILELGYEDDQVYEAISSRLRWQREHFGLVATDDQIEQAARAGSVLKRQGGR